MIKTIFFDLDNTLFSYDKPHHSGLKAAYRILKKKKKLSYVNFLTIYDECREEVHNNLIGLASVHSRLLYFKKMTEKLFKKTDIELTLKLKRTYWNAFLKNMEKSEGTDDVLKFCKNNEIKVAIVSNLTTEIQLEKIKKLSIGKYIEYIITSEETGKEKPDETMFLYALKHTNTNPSETLMVGDEIKADIEGANLSGIKTVMIYNKDPKIETAKYKNPTYIIHNLLEIKEIIMKENHKDPARDGYTKFDCVFSKSEPIEKEKITELNKYRQKLYDLHLIGAYPNGVGFGNISIRNGKDIIITGTKTGNFNKLNETNYSIVKGYDIAKNKVFCEGATEASSETMTHAALYDCSEDINAVIHIHNLKMWNRYIDKIPTTSRAAEYGTPEIAFEVQRLFRETEFRKLRIAVLGGHKEGLIAFGKNLKEAFDIIFEYYSKIEE